MHLRPVRSAVRTRLAAVALAFCGASALSCSSDHITRDSSEETIPARAQVAAGDEQFGEPGVPLRSDVVVLVTDTAGSPLVGVEVTWHAEDGGSIDPPVSVTDENGRAPARWTLGPDSTTHHAFALVAGGGTIHLTATSALPPPPVDQIRLIELETYDGSNETVHPDFATADDSWPAPRRYLAITPYPNSDANLENPSFYESYRSTRWHTPPGGTNPVDITAPPNYLSDPDILFDPDAREFRLYYREVNAENLIFMIRSSDGVHWEPRTLVARGLNHQIISPTVVRRSATEWLMWSVDGNLGCPGFSTAVDMRRSTDGVHWSQPERTNMSATGIYAWHLEVQWMADLNEYWAVFNRKEGTSCTTAELYLATSPDGLTWNIKPTPLLTSGVIPEFEDVVYRSTFTYNPSNGIVTFWYSGARYDGERWVWHSAVQRRLRSNVLHDVNQPRPPANLVRKRKVPALMDPP